MKNFKALPLSNVCKAVSMLQIVFVILWLHHTVGNTHYMSELSNDTVAISGTIIFLQKLTAQNFGVFTLHDMQQGSVHTMY